MIPLTTAAYFLFPAGMALAASMDLLTMTIPNRLCLAIALAFAPFAVLFHAPLALVLAHLTCGAAVLVAMFAFFSFGWIGGGDAKLAAAAALWIGWGSLLDFGVSTAILGGALTLALLAIRQVPLPAALSRLEWLARLHHPKTGVPYGIALAAAAILIFPQTAILRGAA